MAALLAGLALGWWNSFEEIAELPQTVDHFAPAMADNDRKRRYEGWKAAVARVLLNPEVGV